MNMKLIGRYKNGNYMVSIFNDGTKIRETAEDCFLPAFAENCDCKITDKCDGGCAFCYEGCTPNGKHGDILNYKFLDTLHPYTELALNGNDLTHPDLIPFLEKLKEKKVIANMTVNQIHFERCQDMIRSLVDNGLINGLGVSLREPTEEFISLIKTYPNAVVHVINGILKPTDVEAMADNNIKMLILGYKQMRRGADWYNADCENIISLQSWLSINLKDIIERFAVVSFDNLAIEQLNVKSLLSDEEWEEFYMGDDGTMTFYLDLVEGTFGKNSLTPESERFAIENLSIDEMFKMIQCQSNKN
jgi:hypothetical protein